MTRSKTKKEKAAAAAAAATASNAESSSPSALIICRNKHWRYISSFHGPWLQLPPEVLESLAYSNYAAPRPRPIDPAVFFDLVKIRRHVDEATTLAVRAASGVASSLSPKDHHLLLGGGGGPGGVGGGGGPRLSRERKHRMRELAAQKLAKAYKLDEIAASVATMQSASSLEDVAGLVLQREERNADAEYVHFFHEKIPSRMLAKCTSLAPLDRVVDAKPGEGAPLRTRAVTRVFKEDFVGAAQDLTKALLLSEQKRHDETTATTTMSANNTTTAITTLERGKKLLDEEMPSSLEGQLLFHRAGTYLSVAVQAVEKTFAAAADNSANNNNNTTTTTTDDRKTVRTHAKRALRDYSRFLSGFDYTPKQNSGEVYSVSSLLLTSTTLLPKSLEEVADDTEAVTYHPLLTDALYAMLLCHLLLATPRKELERYVAVVNRLARIADGYPVFLAARSPARADWGEVVKKAKLEFVDEAAGSCGEYPVSTERAGLVARWVTEGWGGVVAAQKRRRKKVPANTTAEEVAAFAALRLE